MANALAHESSPYLLQHRDNPVDWLPWGDEALRRARDEDRPLLVSIGYSSCHWCHVMERESFEDPAVAALMNERFVCVKVDREERPDVDAVCMEAVQAMTGHGGWPLNVFLTPDQVPFYGGTYFPPEPRHGMPAWRAVLEAVGDAWATKRDEIRAQGERMAQRLAMTSALRASDRELDAGTLDDAVRNLASQFDAVNGGFGGAPKFPPSSVLPFLLARAARGGDWGPRAGEMALATLRGMASGGMYDQIGGGFARYSVDATWTVPHFEKMLYDNALLARAYVEGWQLTGEPLLRRVAEETLGFVARELRGPEGGFLGALDADSEGVEGKFYVWTVGELRDALGEDADAAIAWLGATEQGNFADPHHPAPGLNVLTARGPEPPAQQRERIRARLLELRAARVRPGLDDKRLTAWNGLAIAAFAEAGAVLARDDLLDVARTAAEFVLGSLRDDGGRLLRTWKDGEAKIDGYLEDHAFLLEALVALYEATFEPRWLAEAQALAGEIASRFAAPAELGGFFTTAADRDVMVARRRDLEDAPIPSGSSSAALGLLRLAALTGRYAHEDLALTHLRLIHELLGPHPQAFGHALQALDFHLGPPREVALAGDDAGVAELAAVVRETLRPALVLAGPPGDGVPLMEGREPVGGQAAAYVCERFACRRPVTDAAELRTLLEPS